MEKVKDKNIVELHKEVLKTYQGVSSEINKVYDTLEKKYKVPRKELSKLTELYNNHYTLETLVQMYDVQRVINKNK